MKEIYSVHYQNFEGHNTTEKKYDIERMEYDDKTVRKELECITDDIMDFIKDRNKNRISVIVDIEKNNLFFPEDVED